MENLNIEKFSPAKTEIQRVVEEYSQLTIDGISDKEGYTKVDAARKVVKKMRVDISKQGKLLREDAVKFQKAVLSKEKELIEMLNPTEKRLMEMQEEIDRLKEMESRKELLPDRIQSLKNIDIVISDELLLTMDDRQFNEFYYQKKAAHFEEKERIAKEEQEKKDAELKKQQDALAEEKRKLEEEKRLEEAKREAEHKAREDAIEEARLAKIKAEEEKEKAVEDEKRKAKEEADRVAAETKRKEDERIAEEARKKKEEEDRIAIEKAKDEKLRKEKMYIDWLKRNGWHVTREKDFYIARDGNTFTLYKKIDSITII